MKIGTLTVDINADSTQLNKSIDRAKQSVGGFTNSVKPLNNELGNLSRVSKIAAAGITALATSMVAKNVVEYGDAWTSVNNKIRQVTKTNAEFESAQKSVLDISIETRSNLEATAALYSRTARQAETLGISLADVEIFTRGVNQALQSYGATAAESASATLQLSQALGKGVLNGDEFRAVAEAAPPIMDAIARAAGVSVGKLKDMGAAGELSADLVVQGVLLAAQKFDNDFSKAVATAASKLEIVRTNAIKFVGTSKTLSSAIDGFSDSAVVLSENLDTIADAAILVGAAFGARFSGPIIAGFAAATASQLAYTKASLSGNVVTLGGVVANKQKAEALLATSAAGLIKAKSETSLAAAEVAAYTATLNSVKAEVQLENVRLKAQINDVGRAATVQRMAALRMELAAATAALGRAEATHAAVLAAETTAMNAATAATSRFTGATAAATIGVRAMTGAVAAGSGALALIGGPIGAAILAAVAIASFQEELGLVGTPAKTVAADLSRLRAGFDGLAKSQANQMLVTMKVRMVELQGSVDEANAAMQKALGEQSVWGRLNPNSESNQAIKKATELTSELAAQMARVSEAEQILGIVKRPKAEIEPEEDEKAKKKAEAERKAAEKAIADAKEAAQRALDDLRERYASETELLTMKSEEDSAILNDALKNELISKEEAWAAELEIKAAHEAALTAIEQDEISKRTELEQRHNDAVKSMREGALNQAVTLLSVLGQKSKTAAYAALALQKGLAIAETFASTQAASMRALAELGPIAGAPVAAAIETAGYTKMGLIAATGLAQGAGMGGGGSSGIASAAENANQQAQTNGGSSGRTLAIQGINPNDLFTGRQLVELINQAQEDGARIITV